MPFRITRPSNSAHVPYSMNEISKRLSDLIEVDVVPAETGEVELDYGNDPTKPAFARRILPEKPKQ